MTTPTTTAEHAPLYRIMVDHPFHGWIPAGPFHRDKSVAAGWLPFVKSAWHRLPCRTVHVASLVR